MTIPFGGKRGGFCFIVGGITMRKSVDSIFVNDFGGTKNNDRDTNL